MKRTFAAIFLAALALAAEAQPAAAASAISARDKLNSLGITVVRFSPGTSVATMRSIVQSAGAEVITDLHQVNALAVRSTDPQFATRVSASPRVKSAHADYMIPIRFADAAGPSGGVTGKNDPALGNPGPNSVPDPWHNLPSFLGETNPEHILQWDDNRMNVPAAWSATGTGLRAIRVAVLDTGVQGSHKELLANYDNQTSTNTIPCNLLVRIYGPLGNMDCSSEDTEGHGTWVASRIAGAVNGFASNGVAPNVQIVGVKVLSTTLGGGLTSWIVAGMIHACDHDVDLINMSIGGYSDPNSLGGRLNYLLWVDAVNYCLARGTAIFASAGNEHVRINRTNIVLNDANNTPHALAGVGQVDSGDEGISTIIPGDKLEDYDLRGLLEQPAGVPGVVMVSATGNANGAPTFALNPNIDHPPVGATDQLAYYSNYGSRIDIAAPGGARKLGIPRYDAGNQDILYGGWGILGALDPSGEICTDPSLASILTFTCFKVRGAGFGWLQGTSMSSPNTVGVAALVLSTHTALTPSGLLARLQSTARTNMVNYVGRNDPLNKEPSFAGVVCDTGFCHLFYGGGNAISSSDAYGAGIVDAAAAAAP